MRTEAQRIEAALARLVAPGSDADAASVAAAGCSIWRRITEILSPIIGGLGVAALYKRSLHLTRVAHPWLPGPHDDPGGLDNLDVLQRALASQTASIAAAANTALLVNFHDLLSSLIGPSLTERLLGSVLDKPSTEHAAQDPSP